MIQSMLKLQIVKILKFERSSVAVVLDELMRRYEDLGRRAGDLRRYL